MRKSVQWNGWALLYKVAKQKWTNNTNIQKLTAGNFEPKKCMLRTTSGDKRPDLSNPFRNQAYTILVAWWLHSKIILIHILTTFYQGIPSMQRTSFDVNSIAVGNLPAASCSIRAKHRSLTLEALLRQTEAPVVPKMRLDVPRKNSKISKYAKITQEGIVILWFMLNHVNILLPYYSLMIWDSQGQLGSIEAAAGSAEASSCRSDE